MNHIRVFSALEGARVKVCCDSDLSRLSMLHKAFPAIATTTDYGKVIGDKNIDAVIIATPTATHFKLVKEALYCGKHVLCEKPLTVREDEGACLREIARKGKRVLMVGYVFLYNNGIIALKEYIDTKKIGKVFYLHFTRTNLGPIRDDVDVIYDLASHDVAIATFLLGKWPLEASANAGFFLRKRIADTAFVTLRYPENVLVNIHASWLDPKKIRRLTCVGDKKMAVWDDMDMSEPIRIFDKGVVKEPFYSDYGEFHLLPREGEVVSPLVKLSEPLKKQDAYFLECVNNKKVPLTGADFGRRVTGALESIQRSVKNQGRAQKIR